MGKVLLASGHDLVLRTIPRGRRYEVQADHIITSHISACKGHIGCTEIQPKSSKDRGGVVAGEVDDVSNTLTWCPDRRKRMAAIRPQIPLPTMITNIVEDADTRSVLAREALLCMQGSKSDNINSRTVQASAS